MSTKHTPGPWTPEFSDSYKARAPHGGIVAQIHNLKGRYGTEGRIHGDEAAANCRLIAAAPELLVALQDLSDAVRGWSMPEGPSIVQAQERAFAAIAKATGGAA